MKVIKKICFCFLFLFVFLIGCKETKVESLVIVGPENIKVGETLDYTIEVTPNDANVDGVEWQSSEQTIATVTKKDECKGAVTALRAGSTVISATLGDVEAVLVVTVEEDVTVTNILIDEDSLKTATEQPKFNFTNVKIKVVYSNNTEELINLDASMFSEDDLKKLNSTGLQSVTINYGGFSKKVQIKIPLVTMKSIEVDMTSVENAYKQSAFVYQNIKVKAKFSDLSEDVMSLNESMLSSEDLVKLYLLGTHEITVKYSGFETKFTVTVTDDFTINVEELVNVNDNTVVVLKCNYVYHMDKTLYLQGGDETIKAVSKTTSLVNGSNSALTLGNELYVIGKKTTSDGKNSLKDLVAIAEVENGNDVEVLAQSVDYSDINEDLLYNYVTFEGYKLTETPGVVMTYGKNNDKTIKVMVSNKDISFTAKKGDEVVTITVLAESDDTFAQSLFVKYDEFVVGHEMILENIFVYKNENGDVELIVTSDSNVDYVKVNHEFQGLVGVNASETDNEEFNKFLDEMFLTYLGDSPFNFNWFIFDKQGFIEKYAEAAERLGIDYNNLEVEYTDYNDWTVENELEYFNTLNERKEILLSFDKSTLSVYQQLAYDVLLDDVNATLNYFITDENGNYQGLYYGTQLGSYLGYQAQIPTTLAEYRFDEKQDIEDYFLYLEYIPYDFDAMYKYEKDKVLKGEGNQMSDYVINLVIEQCDNYTKNDETPYLITAFEISMSKADFLTEEEKEKYIAKNEELVNGVFKQAYLDLKENMLELKSINEDDGIDVYGGLYQFEFGKEYYQAMFQDKCGSDMTIEELIVYIKDKLEEYEFVSTIYSSYGGNLMEDADLIAYTENGGIDYYGSLHNVIPFLQEAVKDDFPLLAKELVYGEDIQIKEVHEAMQDNSSPAAYYISPIDANTSEVIYINPRDFSEVGSYMYQTLAHEGYPGHLYQNFAAKNSQIQDLRMMISYTGYAEGWANYVENYVPKYIINSYEQLEMFEYSSLANLSMCMIDIGVNYLGWGVNEIIKQYGLTVEDVKSGQYTWSNGDTVSMDDFEEVYYFYVEVPTNYLMYFFSTAQLLDIKADFKEKMGIYYSDKLFHTIFVEAGDCSWSVLQEVYNNYANVYGMNGTYYQ